VDHVDRIKGAAEDAETHNWDPLMGEFLQG
jgi:hypothetical protein